MHGFHTLAAACLVFTLSCGHEVLAPSMEEIAGDYQASSFLANGVDVLAAGGDLTLRLTADGAVSGSMSVPANGEGAFNADMAGTYVLDGNRLTFKQSADTFVRDATWHWSNGRLGGSWKGASGSVEVTLVRHSVLGDTTQP